jgi:hypothetical protein
MREYNLYIRTPKMVKTNVNLKYIQEALFTVIVR